MRVAHALVAALLSTAGLTYVAATPVSPSAPVAVQRSAAPQAPALQVTPPAEDNSVRFAIIGDTGTGTSSQYDIGAQLTRARQTFPFEFVIMLGDNIYGSERPQDFVNKFEKPYQALLDAKVPFYAALGNHDDPTQRYYKPFNMNGDRYYTFTKGSARFFVLDSNYMDQTQLKWLDDELSRAKDRWKIAYFHHPLYSSGKHGSEVDLRTQVEPLFMKYGVDVVFAGHEHFYERIKPQNGIYYFIAGGSAKLRKGDIRRGGPLTAQGFDTDYSFMLAELGKEAMQFQVLTRAGKTVDSGTLRLAEEPGKPAESKRSSR